MVKIDTYRIGGKEYYRLLYDDISQPMLVSKDCDIADVITFFTWYITKLNRKVVIKN